MAKIELFQAVLNKMLSDIRDDALDALRNPPNQIDVNVASDDELEKQAKALHLEGETGAYLCLLAVLEIRNMERRMRAENELK